MRKEPSPEEWHCLTDLEELIGGIA